MSVRKNLTEIMLEVTNEEIKSIARETHTRLKTKGSLKFTNDQNKSLLWQKQNYERKPYFYLFALLQSI